jgi:hypothetical protein
MMRLITIAVLTAIGTVAFVYWFTADITPQERAARCGASGYFSKC